MKMKNLVNALFKSKWKPPFKVRMCENSNGEWYELDVLVGWWKFKWYRTEEDSVVDISGGMLTGIRHFQTVQEAIDHYNDFYTNKKGKVCQVEY